MQRRLLIRLIIFIFIFAFLLSTTAFSLSEQLSEFTEKAKEITNSITPKRIIDLFTSNLLSFGRQIVASLGACICVIIVSSVLSVIKSSFEEPEGTFELISCCLIILIVFSPITACFIKVQEHIEAVCGFMISMIPTFVTLHTASGNTLSASLMSYGTGTIITLLQVISMSVIIPLTKASLAVLTVNSITRNLNLTGISSAMKNISLWLIGLSFTIFTGILSLQSILQAGADNLAIKGLKYGAAKLIPIAGGMISESLKTVLTSVGYIKSVTGISVIVFIIYAVIPPLCFILLTKTYLGILSAASKVSSLTRISTYLDSANSTVNILLALLLSSSVCLIVILTIFIKSTVSI